MLVDEEGLDEVVVQEPERDAAFFTQHRGLVRAIGVLGQDAFDDEQPLGDAHRGVAWVVGEQHLTHPALRETTDDCVAPAGEDFAHASPRVR